MHVVFASMGHAELMGIESLSAWLRRDGHRVSLVPNPWLLADGFDLELPALARMLDQREGFITRILELRPNLMGFSCVTVTWARACGNASRLRRRSVEHVIEELRWARGRLDFRCVEFHDDVFTLETRWL